MGAPEGGLRECAHKRYPQTCEFDPTHVLKAMFPLITRQHAGWPLHSHTQLVVPSASFTCQAENLSEIESENNARKILKSCITGEYVILG